MKNTNYIIFLSIFLSFYGKAQLSLAKEDGTPISDGSIITYNSTEENLATLHYKIKNNSAVPINVRAKVMNIVNADGSSFQFCYQNTCLPFIMLGAVYPGNSKPAINIPANSEVSSGYTMWNSDTGSGTFPMDYVLKYYLVDSFNNEYGTPVTFTYRYNPNATLAVHDMTKSKVSFAEIDATIVKSVINVISKEDISYVLYTSDGRTALAGNLNTGKNVIDVSHLQQGNYIVFFKNRRGEAVSKKIIKE
ncbi:T9SS type A sorting domain-containing protein [Chryseobacterium sp. AG844]|uniref:T9SS type A sorting domain-containing protein n=1 Tax=Chryseobacterium sp. AG844 TaxID=2183998 RepID=UPI000D711220|nr:T9SS type A sorting domain-containing protein [Chryseobacterium sp. AG844]PWW14290.1 putative secreted protein (Por secretion system target) [Chryseobacterium sp. AG844]